MDSANTSEAIDDIVDENIAIINQSGWDPTAVITVSNKAEIIQGLLLDEVITKREQNIRALTRGMDHFGILSLLLKYPDKFAELFTHTERNLTAEDLKKMIILSNPPKTQAESSAYQYFLDYLDARENEPPGTPIFLLPLGMS